MTLQPTESPGQGYFYFLIIFSSRLLNLLFKLKCRISWTIFKKLLEINLGLHWMYILMLSILYQALPLRNMYISPFILIIFHDTIHFLVIFCLCYYCYPRFSLFEPLHPDPSTHSLTQSPHHCPCPWVLHICSLHAIFPILYFTSPWLFCNYHFVLLNPFTFFTHTPMPATPPPPLTWQPSKRSLYLWFCFCSACLIL